MQAAADTTSANGSAVSRFLHTAWMRAACSAGVLLIFCLADAHAQPPSLPPSLNDVVLAYCTGAIERALQGLTEHLATSDAPRTARQWMQSAVRETRYTDLEAALLLCAESIRVVWIELIEQREHSHSGPYSC